MQFPTAFDAPGGKLIIDHNRIIDLLPDGHKLTRSRKWITLAGGPYANTLGARILEAARQSDIPQKPALFFAPEPIHTGSASTFSIVVHAEDDPAARTPFGHLTIQATLQWDDEDAGEEGEDKETRGQLLHLSIEPTMLFVNPAHRGQGHALSLVEGLLEIISLDLLQISDQARDAACIQSMTLSVYAALEDGALHFEDLFAEGLKSLADEINEAEPGKDDLFTHITLEDVVFDSAA